MTRDWVSQFLTAIIFMQLKTTDSEEIKGFQTKELMRFSNSVYFEFFWILPVVKKSQQIYFIVFIVNLIEK